MTNYAEANFHGPKSVDQGSSFNIQRHVEERIPGGKNSHAVFQKGERIWRQSLRDAPVFAIRAALF